MIRVRADGVAERRRRPSAAAAPVVRDWDMIAFFWTSGGVGSTARLYARTCPLARPTRPKFPAGRGRFRIPQRPPAAGELATSGGPRCDCVRKVYLSLLAFGDAANLLSHDGAKIRNNRVRTIGFFRNGANAHRPLTRRASLSGDTANFH